MTRPAVEREPLESEWQARIFGIVFLLIDNGVFTWAEFREACLSIESPREEAHDGHAGLGDWAPALRSLLETRGLLLELG